MTLRRKLLLVALCTLALPIAGWSYVRQMETLLREGQAQALLASANAVARSLVVTGAVAPASGRGWYVQPATGSASVHSATSSSLRRSVIGAGGQWPCAGAASFAQREATTTRMKSSSSARRDGSAASNAIDQLSRTPLAAPGSQNTSTSSIWSLPW